MLLASGGGALVGSALVTLFHRDGPSTFERRAFSRSLVATVLRDRRTGLAIGGYLGHMWERYAMWTWLPTFLAASLAARTPGLAPSVRTVADLFGFAAIAAGGLGCVWGGWAATRHGYARVVTWSMLASGACALGIGVAFGSHAWLLLTLASVWGFFVVADSAQFSALVTELAPSHAVGTALMPRRRRSRSRWQRFSQPGALTFGWRRAFPVLASAWFARGAWPPRSAA